MIYTKQLRIAKDEVGRIIGIAPTEVCLTIDFYYDTIHNECVVNCLVVSTEEVIKTLFPNWAIPENPKLAPLEGRREDEGDT